MTMPGDTMRRLGSWLPGDALRAAHHAAPSPGTGQFWTIAAVIAAFLGSGIVAWQAWETHRTTDLSKRALEASQSLAIDSARSRLDADAPRIEVYVEQVSVLPADSRYLPGSAAESGAPWNLARDAERLLRVQARVQVVNLMTDRTIHLKVTGLQDEAMHADTEILLVPAKKLYYFLTATFTLSQWAENWESLRDEKPFPYVAEGSVRAGDDRDEGVVDTWPLRLAAWPIQPAGDSAGTWLLTSRIAGSQWFDITMRPLRQRSYWISQRDNIPMPEPNFYKPS
jgi:hypothetical protein